MRREDQSAPAARWVGVGVIAIALSGAMLLLWITRVGPAVDPDAVTYLRGAAQIASGHGFVLPETTWDGHMMSVPITHFPPLFPAAVAVPMRAGFDGLRAVRWLHALLFAVNIWLVAAIVRSTTHSAPATLATAVLFAAARPLLNVYSGAASEPLFFVTSLLGFHALATFLSSQRWRWLWAASAALALACLTRYAGWAWIGAAVLVLATDPWARSKFRASVAVLSAGAGLLPSVWVLRNRWIGGNFTNRSWHINHGALATLAGGLTTVNTWILPKFFPVPWRNGTVVLAISTLLATVGFVFRANASRCDDRSRATHTWLMILAWASLSYFALLTFSMMFLDSAIPFDDPKLSPLAIIALPVVVITMHEVVFVQPFRPWLKRIVLTGGAVMTVLWLAKTASWAPGVARQGQWYSGRAWQQSELCRLAAAAPPDRPVWSNAPDAVDWITGRTVRPLPPSKDPATLRALGTLLRTTGGRVAWFDTVPWRTFYPSIDELLQAADARVTRRANDGIMLTAAAQGSE